MKTLPPRLKVRDNRRLKPPPKTAAPIYRTSEYRVWRAKVIGRAGGRCEWIEAGSRCPKGEPERMFADHRIELKDGGAEFDPANGQCLCGSHHTLKTMIERAKRASA
jgi:5-methylcytosine-specific restriction protein A